MGIVYGLLTAFFLSIPFLNKFVLKTVDLEEMKRHAREYADSIATLREDGQYAQMRQYCFYIDSLVGGRNDAPSQFIAQFAFLNAAQSHMLAGEYEEAVDVFEQMLEKYPQSTFAENIFFTAGQALMQAKEYERAIGWFERLEKNRELSVSFPKYRHVNINPGKYVDLDKLSQKKETTSRIYTTKEQQKEVRGENADAGGNTLADAVVKIGECYLALGKSDSARTQFELIADYFPDSDRLDDMQKLIADTYFNDGQKFKNDAKETADSDEKLRLQARAQRAFEAAKSEYLKFLNRYSESDLASQVYIQLAASNFEMGLDKDGEKVFTDAIRNLKVIEKQAEVQLEIGNYYNRVESFQKAAEAYGKVVKNYSETQFAGRAQFLLSVMYENVKDTVKAMEGYQLVSDNYRSSDVFPEAAFKLAMHYYAAKEYEKSDEYFNLIVRQRPNDPVAAKALFQQGLMAMDKKDWNEAIRKFSSAKDVGIASIYDMASLKLADCYEALGETKAAQKERGNIQDETLRDELFWDDEGSKLVPTKKLDQIRQKLLVKKSAKDRSLWYGKLAEVYADMGTYDSAIIAMDSAIANSKSRLKTNGLRMQKAQYLATDSLKRFDDALALLQNILDKGELIAAQRAKVQYDISDILRRNKDFAGAKASYRDFVKTYAASEDEKELQMSQIAELQLASLLQREGHWDSALVVYQEYLKLFPESPQVVDALLGAAEAKVQIGEGEAGIQYALEYVEQHKKSIFIEQGLQRIHYQLGGLYANQLSKKSNDPEYYKKAEGHYLKALEGDSVTGIYSAAAFGLGVNYLKWGEAQGNREEYLGKAESAFSKVSKESPSYFKAARNELSKIIAKRDWKEGLASLNEALDQSYRDYTSFKAKEEFQKAMTALNETVVAILAVGNIYSDQKMYADAANAYKRVFEEFTEADSTMQSAAMIQTISALSKANKNSELRQVVERMVKTFPNSPYTAQAVYFKASSYMEEGAKNQAQYGKAYDAFQALINLIEKKENLSPGEKQLYDIAYYQQGDCLFAMKQYAKAIQAYERTIKKFPDGKYRCASLFQIGNSYWSQQDYEEALKNYKKVDESCNEESFPQFCLNMGYYAKSLEKADRTKDAKAIFRNCERACKQKAQEYKTCHEGSERLLINN